MVVDITLKQKEQKILKFTYLNATTGAIIPLTGATFTLVIFLDDNAVVTKNDIDFDKTDVANGIVRVTLTQTDLDREIKQYSMQVKTVFSNGEIDKSKIFTINITQSLFS
jgi:hypothetical protein